MFSLHACNPKNIKGSIHMILEMTEKSITYLRDIPTTGEDERI